MANDYRWDLFLSHASADKPIVERMADALQKAGLTVWLDKWAIKGGDSIAGKIEEGLKGSRRLIVFMSPASSGSDWVTRERDVIFFRKHGNVVREIIPVLLKDCEIGLLLIPIQYIDFRTPNAEAWRGLLEACGAKDLDFPYPFGTSFFPPALPPPPRNRIDLHHLPTTGGQLFGREGPLRDLDLAWDSPEWRIWVLVAEGGVGKTGLVLRWLEQMSLRQFAGAAWVFGWSFYSQGTQEDRQASSEPFLEEALKFFGDQTTYPTARAKGKRLAELVGETRGLLVLDGLEPLQYPPGEAMQGRLRDAGMEALLKGLAWHNPGLCVVTTRVPLSELAGKQVVRQHTLDHLTTEAGAALLNSYHLQATPKELEEASTEYDGHALALNLLGAYLRAVHGGEIRKRDQMASLADERALGSHAKKVMASDEIWLKEKAELGLLYLMALFDRPAEAGEIQAVLAKPAIDGLTDRLPEFGSEAWNNAVSALSDLRLLSPASDNPKNALECHPLVLEYFGEQLQKTYPAAWREANRRLFDYFRAIPTEEKPDTIEALLPLYRAIPHGCQAGLHQQALVEVYKARIARGESYYAVHQLGAYGLELGAMAAFFEQPWSRPAAGLRELDRSLVLNLTAYQLRATGRLQEAMQPEATALGMALQQKNWQNAAGSASNLSESSLTCADLSQAIAYAEQAVVLAETSGDAFQQMAYRTTLADALHQAGMLAEAETLFQEAEARQQKGQPNYPRLYAFQGYYYHDLLLTQKQYQAVWERAEYDLKIVTEQRWLLPVFLDQLTLGQAAIGLENWAEAEQWLNQAVDGLWQVGSQDSIPRGLIARAGFYRLQRKWVQAGRDLEEAKEISQRGGMLYFEIPIHLEESQLALAQGEESQAKQALNLAENRIQKTGLFRFAPLADQIRQELGERPRIWDRTRLSREIQQAKEALFKQYPPPQMSWWRAWGRWLLFRGRR